MCNLQKVHTCGEHIQDINRQQAFQTCRVSSGSGETMTTLNRKACPKCGEVMFRDCNSDETVFFWSCTECNYSEKRQEEK